MDNHLKVEQEILAELRPLDISNSALDALTAELLQSQISYIGTLLDRIDWDEVIPGLVSSIVRLILIREQALIRKGIEPNRNAERVIKEATRIEKGMGREDGRSI